MNLVSRSHVTSHVTCSPRFHLPFFFWRTLLRHNLQHRPNFAKIKIVSLLPSPASSFKSSRLYPIYQPILHQLQSPLSSSTTTGPKTMDSPASNSGSSHAPNSTTSSTPTTKSKSPSAGGRSKSSSGSASKNSRHGNAPTTFTAKMQDRQARNKDPYLSEDDSDDAWRHETMADRQKRATWDA